LRAEESKLLPGGFVDRSTSKWLPRPEYNEDDIYTVPSTFTAGIVSDSFHLDNYLNEPIVLTSIGIKQTSNILKPIFQYSTVNFTAGTVNDKFIDEWFIANCTTCKKYSSNNLTLPTYSSDNHKNYASHISQFGTSKFQDDLGQSTLPFIDILPLESDSALSGGGFRIRRKIDNGGIIAPVLISINFAQLIETEKLN